MRTPTCLATSRRQRAKDGSMRLVTDSGNQCGATAGTEMTDSRPGKGVSLERVRGGATGGQDSGSHRSRDPRRRVLPHVREIMTCAEIKGGKITQESPPLVPLETPSLTRAPGRALPLCHGVWRSRPAPHSQRSRKGKGTAGKCVQREDGGPHALCHRPWKHMLTQKSMFKEQKLNCVPCF